MHKDTYLIFEVYKNKKSELLGEAPIGFQDTFSKKELDLYHSLQENTVEGTLAEKFVKEVESRYEKLDKNAIFNEQTQLINRINKALGTVTYNSFIPNYKDIATIAQIFNPSTPIKQKLILEQSIIEKIKIVKEEKNKNSLQPVDNLIYKTFSKKFNEKYNSLLAEQKNLLTKYVNSFTNNGVELKIFLNEEIQRLKEDVENALNSEEIKSNPEMVEKTQKTIDFLKNFKEVKDISQEMLQKVMKIQQFVHEVSN
jgi:hypothetical protein